MDVLTGLFDGLDPEVMPELGGLIDKLVPMARIAVMAAPVALLVLGLVYLFLAPKEANHMMGFRCWWGMGSVEVWRFTQKLAGIVWAAMGLIMGITMFVISGSYKPDAPTDMLADAVVAIIWELIFVVVSILAINLVIIVLYDHKGIRRSEKKEIEEEFYAAPVADPYAAPVADPYGAPAENPFFVPAEDTLE